MGSGFRAPARSEERGGGKEGRSRWPPYHQKSDRRRASQPRISVLCLPQRFLGLKAEAEPGQRCPLADSEGQRQSLVMNAMLKHSKYQQ